MCFGAFIGFLQGIFLGKKNAIFSYFEGFEDFFDPLYILEVVLNTIKYTFCYQLYLSLKLYVIS